MKHKKPSPETGFSNFVVVWFGELISVIGTSMTTFALMIYAFNRVGRASTTALLGLASVLPFVLLSPIAGTIVDSHDRKRIMLAADAAAGFATIILLILYSTGHMPFWCIYAMTFCYSVSAAFQSPAYSSSITLLMPKEQYHRASSMRSFSEYTSKVLSPVLGGILLGVAGIRGILIIDIITYLFALTMLASARIPSPDFTTLSRQERKLSHNMVMSFAFFRQNKGLKQLLVFFGGINLIASTTYFGILSAMILTRSHNNTLTLSLVQSALGLGGIAGSILLGLLKSPKNKVNFILATTFFSFILGDPLFAVGRSIPVWCTGAFLTAIFIPMLVGGEYTLWQQNVPPELQGRIFALRNMLAQLAMPAGYLLGGFSADFVFEPAMKHDTLFHHLLSPIVGSGAGSGMASMFLFSCACGIFLCTVSFFNKEFQGLK